MLSFFNAYFLGLKRKLFVWYLLKSKWDCQISYNQLVGLLKEKEKNWESICTSAQIILTLKGSGIDKYVSFEFGIKYSYKEWSS